jgi:hypothetical protein
VFHKNMSSSTLEVGSSVLLGRYVPTFRRNILPQFLETLETTGCCDTVKFGRWVQMFLKNMLPSTLEVGGIVLRGRYVPTFRRNILPQFLETAGCYDTVRSGRWMQMFHKNMLPSASEIRSSVLLGRCLSSFSRNIQPPFL